MDARNTDRKLKVEPRGDREIVMTRVLAAPRRLVFDAWTQPAQLKRWFGPRAWAVEVCEIDLRVGGAWRYVLKKTDGARMVMKGVYKEIVPGERLVCTESFDNWFAGESLDTMTFVEHGDLTTVTTVVRYPSQEIRDEVMKSPMEEGAGESYDRLDEFLAR